LRITALDRQSPLQDRPALAVCFAAESNLPALVAAGKVENITFGSLRTIIRCLQQASLITLCRTFERPGTPRAGRRFNADDGSGPGDFVPGLRPFQG